MWAQCPEFASAQDRPDPPAADGYGMHSPTCHIGLKYSTPLAMSQMSTSVEVCLGRQGRMVIPAPLRRSLGLKEGDRLVVRQDAGRLVLEKPDLIKQRLKARFAQIPAERGLVDELIAERREESRREGGG